MHTTAMGKRLRGKTIIITGASSGIGRSTAFEFARTSTDLKLILTARRIDSLGQIAKEIMDEFKTVKVHTVQMDVSNPEEINSFLDNLPVEFQNIDVLVNNA